MKTKAQKQEAVKLATELTQKSQSLAFVDFSALSAEDLRMLRRAVAAAGGKMAVIKKRLLNVMFKQQGIDMDMKSTKVSVGTVFAPAGIDSVAGPLFRFFKEKGGQTEKLLGGYDLVAKAPISKEMVAAIGQLPPREVLLGQLFGTIAGPIRSFLYLLDQKSKQSS